MKIVKLIALVLFLCNCKAKDPYKQFKREIKNKPSKEQVNKHLA